MVRANVISFGIYNKVRSYMLLKVRLYSENVHLYHRIIVFVNPSKLILVTNSTLKMLNVDELIK